MRTTTRRNFLAAAAAAAGLMGLAACSSGTESGGSTSGDGDSMLMGVCMQNMSSSINELESSALKDTFTALGYDVQVVSADDNVSTQTQQIQNFITMGASVLIILPCEIETLEDVLLEARQDYGIKVIVSGGTGSISEDAYDAASSDDEFVIGMYVAAITKAWVEQYLDPDGDWDVTFLSSTISEDAKSRCAGEFMIVEPYLKNEAGDYMNLFGDVVDESEKVENPVYCEMIADRVASISSSSIEMDISGDNRSVVSAALTDNPNARVFIGYNSLISTAGSQYVLDTYPEDEWNEFAFFSAGVMGDEYEYLIGSVSDTAGTRSVFRGAAQFGGGDAAATLVSLTQNVLFGEEGVDYGKSNPNSIGMYVPVSAELNNGVAALVCYDTPTYIEYMTFDEILARDGLSTYWDAVNGYNPEEAEESTTTDGSDGAQEGSEFEGTAYTYVTAGIAGDETLEIDLADDGTCTFWLPGNAMITDVYAGTYTRDGDTVSIVGLANVDTSSDYTTPGLWSFIDSTTGDATITVDDAAGTFEPVS